MKNYVNERRVAQITGFSLKTLRNHRFLNRGIPYSKVGRSIRYLVRDVIDYMEARKIGPEEYIGATKSNSSESSNST